MPILTCGQSGTGQNANKSIERSRFFIVFTYVNEQTVLLKVEKCIEIKILLYTYKVVNGMAPTYLEELLDLYKPGCSLRSENKQLLKTQSYNLKSYGYRAFSVCAPQLWNALPLELKGCQPVTSFKKALKKFLFKEYIFLTFLTLTLSLTF